MTNTLSLPESDKMGGRGKTRLWLFACGILIGACLEILLLETDMFSNMNSSSSDTYGYHGEKNPRINCLILMKHKHSGYVNSSRQTWLKHCDEYHVVSVERIPKVLKPIDAATEPCVHDTRTRSDRCRVPYLRTWVKENILHLPSKSAWSGLCKALLMVKSDRTDWLLIVPDSLIVLVENLKHFVKNLNSEGNYYYGYAVEHYEADYNTLLAGILLSRGSLRKLYQRFQTKHHCENAGKHWRNEDLYLGKYLKEFGIFPKDTRDEDGRGRFHGFNLVNLLNPGKLFARTDYSRKALYPVPEGFNCCSSNLITMDVSDPDVMFKLHFLFYIKLLTADTTVSRGKHEKEMNKTEKSFFWKDFLRERGYSEKAIETMSDEEYYKIWEKILPPDAMYKQMRQFMKNNEKDIF